LPETQKRVIVQTSAPELDAGFQREWSMNSYLRGAHLGRAMVMLLATAGCAQAPASPPVRYADIGSGRLKALDLRLPFVIEFQAGDRLPVDFEFSSEDFELEPARPAMTLVAKQHCYVRFGADGVRVSLDPTNFPDKGGKPGSFRFGLKAVRGEPAKLDVGIATPQR
jgi:hypothetical protein